MRVAATQPLGFRLVARRFEEPAKLADGDLRATEAKGPGNDHAVLRALVGDIPFVGAAHFERGRCRQRLFDLGRSASHQEFSGRDKHERQADGVDRIDIRAEMIGPRLLVSTSRFGIEWRDGP